MNPLSIARLGSLPLAFAAVLLVGTAHAQQLPSPKDNLLGLTSQHSIKVPQDHLTMVLSATREGTSEKTVQEELKKILVQATMQANGLEKGDALSTRTGQFRVTPVYDKEQQNIKGWRGTAQLVIYGKDFSAIATLAANVKNMPVVNVSFDLSPEARKKYETEVQGQAVANFKERASILAKQFGFAGYTIDNVQINTSHDAAAPAPIYMERAVSMSMSKAVSPIPVEAGEAIVNVHVNGTVQMR